MVHERGGMEEGEEKGAVSLVWSSVLLWPCRLRSVQ